MGDVLFIINPAGHGGAGLKAWEAFKKLWPESIDSKDFIVTQRHGHSREVARSAERYRTIAAVGGDGTVGEIMSAVMDRQDSDIRLAIIPAGTGNDIARNVGIGSIEMAVNALHNDLPQAVDIMRFDSQMDDQPIHHYGFLTCAVGFSSMPMSDHG